ncbi:MAG: ice-binding family protein [Candidatus Limnocylindria bacterium]
MAVSLAIGLLAIAPMAYAAGPAAPGLGTAGSFAVLAGAGITNTGPTTITGDVGTFPTTTETGFGSVTLNGTNHAGDAVTQGAQTDLTTAYNTAAGSGPTTPVAADLGGQTLTPGVYNSASALGLTGTLTLSGTSSDVWIFQAGSTLTTASGSSVVFIGGATSCNVYWQIGSSATIGTGSAFKGTIMALTSITVTTGATIEGRALARNGAVTLDTNTITRPNCSTISNTAFSDSSPSVPMAPALFTLVVLALFGGLSLANARTGRRR